MHNFDLTLFISSLFKQNISLILGTHREPAERDWETYCKSTSYRRSKIIPSCGVFSAPLFGACAKDMHVWHMRSRHACLAHALKTCMFGACAVIHIFAWGGLRGWRWRWSWWTVWPWGCTSPAPTRRSSSATRTVRCSRYEHHVVRTGGLYSRAGRICNESIYNNVICMSNKLNMYHDMWNTKAYEHQDMTARAKHQGMWDKLMTCLMFL